MVKPLNENPKLDLNKECKWWGIGLIIAGILPFVFQGIFDISVGIIALLLGVITLVFRKKWNLAVIGAFIILIGALNIITVLTIQAQYAFLIGGIVQILIGIGALNTYHKIDGRKVLDKRSNWFKRHPILAIVLSILLVLILIGIVWVVIMGISQGNSGNTKVNTQLQNMINKTIDVRLCQYELLSYYNTAQYLLFNKEVNTCKTKINEVRIETENLIISETDEALKKEYQAMKLDYEGAAMSMDILTIEVAVLSAEDNYLSQAEYKLKIDTIKSLYAQYLEIINKLETQYSETYFFKNNYGTPEGKEMLQKAKDNAQTSLEGYNNLTIN